MYVCNECQQEFTSPVKLTQRHGLSSPPYEILYVCPRCKSTDYKKKSAEYCRCCGARLKNSDSDYCSEECQTNGMKLQARERKRRKVLYDSDLFARVREVDRYNRLHNTRYSYGQYELLTSALREEKK